MWRWGFILFLLWESSGLAAQIPVKKAVGRWEVTGGVSLVEAEEMALWEAKREALRLAGVEDELQYIYTAFQTADRENFSFMYHRLSRLEVAGSVSVKQKQVRKYYDEVHDRIFVEVTIKASVSNHTRRDAGFKIELEGIHRTYREHDVLTFSCLAYADCYLTIFLFDRNNAFHLYPNKLERSTGLKKGEKLQIPFSREVVYELLKSSDDIIENNVLLVVATRKPIPFIGDVTYERVLEWLVGIPVDERTEEWRSFMIE